MRLAKSANIDDFQATYLEVAAPVVKAQFHGHNPYILLHMRAPDANTFAGPLDDVENYCTAKVIRSLLKQKLGLPIYAISNNVSWANDMLNHRVRVIDESGSAYDHFALLITASAIIQHAWGGWSSYSSVASLVSGVPMINTYDPQFANHRFYVFKSQLGIPPNFYDCNRLPQFVQAVISKTQHPTNTSASHSSPANIAELLYTSEGHQHTVSPRLDDRGLAPLTRWVQSYIHERQFVRDCSTRSFMVTHGWKGGFGAEVHNIGAILGYAIEHNSTLLLSPKSCGFNTDPAICNRGCECVLAPISNCDYNEVLTSSNRPRIVYPDNNGHQFRHFVPSAFKKALMLEFPRMTERQIWYWWRGQSAAFISRFNNETIRIVSRLRHRRTMAYFTDNAPLPFPLPHGTINAHIRGGDKHYEMRLIGAHHYVTEALKLVQIMPNAFASHTLFVSGDDDESVRVSTALAEENGLAVAYSRIRRLQGGHIRDLWDRQGDRVARFYEHLLQLTMSLEADAWVGTRGSNWNRLIDELRCTWVDKCRHSYVEVGDEPLGSYGW